jgi:nucleoside-diphosphate-sugar epimerase
MKTSILVTGATGFVGSSLCYFLISRGYEVRGAVRRIAQNQSHDPGGNCKSCLSYINTGDISPDTDWSQALRDVDTVVHLAARVHVTHEDPAHSLDEYRTVNTRGTVNLANQAARAGVRRFVYLSTVKVHGEETALHPGFFTGQGRDELPVAFSEADVPRPLGGYAISKWEAERELRLISPATGMETVIVRPPLIYGEGVKANFLSLLRMIDKGIPLPFSSVVNRRSLLCLDNLVDFLMHCISHPAAANETFLVADNETLSTPELICRIAFYMGKKPKLPGCPIGLLRMGARLLGRADAIAKICGSLQLDVRKAKTLLHWQPPLTVEQGLEKTVSWYQKTKKING